MMKNLVILLICNFAVASQILLDTKVMDSLLMIISVSEDAKKYDDYKSVSIDGGIGFQCNDSRCKDTISKFALPPGLLISDKKAFLYLYNEKMIEDANRRFIIAKDLYVNYKNQVNKLLELNEKQIEKLEKQNKRTWFEKNNIYVGFAIGLITAIAIESITFKVLD